MTTATTTTTTTTTINNNNNNTHNNVNKNKWDPAVFKIRVQSSESTVVSKASGDSGTSLCTGEYHPSKTRVGSGRTPELPDSYFVTWAWYPLLAITRPPVYRLTLILLILIVVVVIIILLLLLLIIITIVVGHTYSFMGLNGMEPI